MSVMNIQTCSVSMGQFWECYLLHLIHWAAIFLCRRTGEVGGCVEGWRTTCSWSTFILAGLFQGVGQRQTAQAACHCEGQVLQQKGWGEDQGSWRSLCTDGMSIWYQLLKINCIKRNLACFLYNEWSVCLFGSLGIFKSPLHLGDVMATILHHCNHQLCWWMGRREFG